MPNPGPSTTVTANAQSVTTQQCLRLIAFAKGLSVNQAGDVAIPIIGPTTSFVPTTVVTTNANVTMATATVGIYTAPAQGGTAIPTTAALTGQTTQAFAYVRAATAGFYLYVNVGVTVAGGTVDLYLYGYDTSALTSP